jgi:hypothetical protein
MELTPWKAEANKAQRRVAVTVVVKVGPLIIGNCFRRGG